jgi:hypothetical protein
MDCLHCGDCCLRMSPISAPQPCPKLLIYGSFFFCNDYENRPTECRNHYFDSRFCPIGLNVLKPRSLDWIRARIDAGFEKISKKEFKK